MDSKHVAFPFRWILPLSQLVLCLFILWPDRFYVLVEWAGPEFIEKLYETQHSSASKVATKSEPGNTDSTNKTDDSVNLVIPDRPQIERETHRREIRLAITASLNFPVLWVELPFTAFSTSKREWTPHGMDFRVWRATVWPLAGVVFWWLAGRGMEALVAARRKLIAPRIRWIEVIVAGIVFASGVVILIACLMAPPSDRDLLTDLLVFGGVLWMILTVTTIAAWIAQWRIRKAMRSVKDVAPLPC